MLVENTGEGAEGGRLGPQNTCSGMGWTLEDCTWLLSKLSPQPAKGQGSRPAVCTQSLGEAAADSAAQVAVGEAGVPGDLHHGCFVS